MSRLHGQVREAVRTRHYRRRRSRPSARDDDGLLHALRLRGRGARRRTRRRRRRNGSEREVRGEGKAGRPSASSDAIDDGPRVRGRDCKPGRELYTRRRKVRPGCARKGNASPARVKVHPEIRLPLPLLGRILAGSVVGVHAECPTGRVARREGLLQRLVYFVLVGQIPAGMLFSRGQRVFWQAVPPFNISTCAGRRGRAALREGPP